MQVFLHVLYDFLEGITCFIKSYILVFSLFFTSIKHTNIFDAEPLTSVYVDSKVLYQPISFQLTANKASADICGKQQLFRYITWT